MIKKKEEWYNLDYHQFEHLVIYKSCGKDAWKRFQEILINDGKPIVFLSGFHGFSVMDEKTNDPIEKKTSNLNENTCQTIPRFNRGRLYLKVSLKYFCNEG